MAVKRRVVWMDDEDWETLGRLAAETQARSISAMIRDMAHLQRVAETTLPPVAVDRFNSRPFRPVPKRPAK